MKSIYTLLVLVSLLISQSLFAIEPYSFRITGVKDEKSGVFRYIYEQNRLLLTSNMFLICTEKQFELYFQNQPIEKGAASFSSKADCEKVKKILLSAANSFDFKLTIVDGFVTKVEDTDKEIVFVDAKTRDQELAFRKSAALLGQINSGRYLLEEKALEREDAYVKFARENSEDYGYVENIREAPISHVQDFIRHHTDRSNELRSILISKEEKRRSGLSN